MSTIEIKSGNKSVKLSLDDIGKLYTDKKIMEECILAVINPKVAEYSDIYIEPAEAIVWLRNHFMRGGYWRAEFIDEIFGPKQNS
jgi:hypothetical protein